jgi:hypothetical protein
VLSGEPLKFARGTKVRRFAVLALAGAALGLLIPAHAQSFTYGRLVAGQAHTELAYGNGSSWCLVDNGGSLFQINQAATKAVISLSEVIYYDSSANTYYSLDGQDILFFTSASGGTIRFKQKGIYPLSVNTPAFTDFIQTYDASTDQLTVTFSVVFPNCTLPIVAVYDAP